MKELNCDEIRDMLLEYREPVMEIELLKRVFNIRKIPSSVEKLFPIHFTLYNGLYRLREEMGARGYYIHLDPMRIRLIKVPEKNCRYYYPEKGDFCGGDISGHGYCKYHENLYEEQRNRVTFDPLFDFYRNEENITFWKSGILQKLMDGIVLYSVKRGEIRTALDFMGISHPSKKIIQKRYHELAKQYHPDNSKESEEKMKILNVSYQVLMEVFIL